MGESMAAHTPNAVLTALLRTHRKRIFRHNLFYTRCSRVATFDYHTSHQIALGKYADQKSVTKHRHRADIPIDHRLGHFERELLGIGPPGIRLGNQIVNMHRLTLLGTAFQSKRREYMPKCGGLTVPESCIHSTKLS